MDGKIVMVSPDEWLELEGLLDRCEEIVKNGQPFDQSTGDKPSEHSKALEFNNVRVIKKAEVQT